MIQAGCPIEWVQWVLNHRDARMTLVYARLAPQQREEALNMASEIVTELLGEVHLAVA